MEVRYQLLLAVQRALLGEVSSSLRAVTVGWHDHTIQFRSYFDGPISKEDSDSISCVATEVIADFPEPWTIEEEVIQCDAPAPMEILEAWAYYRRE